MVDHQIASQRNQAQKKNLGIYLTEKTGNKEQSAFSNYKVTIIM